MRKIVIEIDETHMPMVRQQVERYGPELLLDARRLPVMIRVKVVGEIVEEARDGYKPDGTYGHVHQEVIRPL